MIKNVNLTDEGRYECILEGPNKQPVYAQILCGFGRARSGQMGTQTCNSKLHRRWYISIAECGDILQAIADDQLVRAHHKDSLGYKDM